jgi:hypothetical protein
VNAFSSTSSGPFEVIICGLCGFEASEEVVAQPPPASDIASKTIVTPGELNRFANIVMAGAALSRFPGIAAAKNSKRYSQNCDYVGRAVRKVESLA